MISRSFRLGFALAATAVVAGGGWASADPIRNPTAVFAGLDKTTGRIINFDVAVDETVQFGSLQVTPRVCNTRPQTEAPQTTGFVEVDEQDVTKIEAKRIFSGWMFAASPGLHGVEHPVYDVWLVDCRGGKEIVQAPAADPGAASANVPAAAQPEKKRSRSRKVEPVAPVPVEAAPIGPRDSVLPEGVKAPDDGAPAPPAEKPKKKKKKQASQPAAAPATSPFPF
ncbi:DUF2155 domain-containing protein [Methylosinus sp. Ce-a6]|uniref:DUF2155 domain-containing protein n=1 Tax=Methylosinus sp. Ce-a6 TaxID=2172005 RepID=UPI00135A6D61|nr:DUF2155 domain-containing protein [Methylosinus sp. Ce-a6]